MKHTLFYLLIGSLLLSACMFEQGIGSNSLIIGKSVTDLKESQRKEREKLKEINRKTCKEDRDCEDICEDVYNDGGDRENEGKVEKCLEMSYKRIVTFQDILDIIEEPYYADLTNIEARDFEAFLEVSVAPWVEKTKRLNNSEAEVLLRWIALESKVASSIESAYKNFEDYDLYEGVQKLFEEIAPSLASYTPGDSPSALERAERRCAEFCSAMSKKSLAQGQSFWDIADDVNNETGLKLACSVLRLKCRYGGSSVISGISEDDCPILADTTMDASSLPYRIMIHNSLQRIVDVRRVTQPSLGSCGL